MDDRKRIASLIRDYIARERMSREQFAFKTKLGKSTTALFASLLAFGVAASGARASDPGPWLVNTGGDLGVVHGAGPANAVGGTNAAIAGGGGDMSYQATPDARAQESASVATLAGGGENARLVHERSAPATMRLADARRR